MGSNIMTLLIQTHYLIPAHSSFLYVIGSINLFALFFFCLLSFVCIIAYNKKSCFESIFVQYWLGILILTLLPIIKVDYRYLVLAIGTNGVGVVFFTIVS